MSIVQSGNVFNPHSTKTIVYQKNSRDKTLMVSDFWLKTVDSLGPKESESGRMRHSRFLKRDIMSL